MKTRNLFLSLFAFAALCACNKEAQPETPQVLGDDAYIQVNIVTPSASTKATEGGYVEGSSDENHVENALFAFYTAGGVKTQVSTDITLTWPTPNQTSENPQVEKISSAKVVLSGENIIPRQMVVILNYNSDILDAVNESANITELNAKLSQVVTTTINEKTCFVMSNSAYWANGKNAFATLISEEHIYSGNEVPAGYKPVDVYVERLAAKVTASGTPDGTISELQLNDGTKLYYYPVIEGYALTATATESHICKYISDYSFTNWKTWNDPNNYRSYWATTCGTAASDFNYLTYSAIGTDTSLSGYYHENTNTSHLSTLIVNAKIKKASDASTRTTESIGNLVKHGPTYYMESEFLTYVAQLFVNEGITFGGLNATAANFAIVPVSGYTSKVGFASGSTPSNEAAAKTILANFDELLFWKDGESYFFTEIEHFGTDAGVNNKGIIRNHAYDIEVKSITGLGTPYLPGVGGGGETPIDPEKPTDIEYHIQAKINILKWKLVSQSVDLN